MQIGRRLYFSLETGELLADTGDREGTGVRETTVDEDHNAFPVLQGLERSLVVMVQGTFGQYDEQFRTAMPRLNQDGKIIWILREQ